jgi:hypothetical protein
MIALAKKQGFKSSTLLLTKDARQRSLGRDSRRAARRSNRAICFF